MEGKYGPVLWIGRSKLQVWVKEGKRRGDGCGQTAEGFREKARMGVTEKSQSRVCKVNH